MFLCNILLWNQTHFFVCTLIKCLMQNSGGFTLKQWCFYKRFTMTLLFNPQRSFYALFPSTAVFLLPAKVLSSRTRLILPQRALADCSVKFLGCKWDCHASEIRRQLTANIDSVFKAFHEVFERQWEQLNHRAEMNFLGEGPLKYFSI